MCWHEMQPNLCWRLALSEASLQHLLRDVKAVMLAVALAAQVNAADAATAMTPVFMQRSCLLRISA